MANIKHIVMILKPYSAQFLDGDDLLGIDWRKEIVYAKIRWKEYSRSLAAVGGGTIVSGFDDL